MKLHEYQAKSLLAQYDVRVPPAVVIKHTDDVPKVRERVGGDAWVVKAQVHAGGRGKGGGVRIVRGEQALFDTVDQLLGSHLVTPQTSAGGLPVETVLVESLSDITHEFYLGMLVDRDSRRITVMASQAGGVDIETVAAETPGKIMIETVQPVTGLMPYQSRKLGFALGLNREQVQQFSRILDGLYRLFLHGDASLIEINPLVITTMGQVMALDAKINLDDNGLYRHSEMRELRDTGQEDPREVRAHEHNLNYIPLKGNIGCMVNGAGLAMATLDLIKLRGGEPANFLDVGGDTDADKVAEAFKLILSDDHVRAVLINIFGGIVRCDLIAEGILQAAREVGAGVPIVVRLEGTNVEQGRRMLHASELNISAADDFEDAADQVVRAV